MAAKLSKKSKLSKKHLLAGIFSALLLIALVAFSIYALNHNMDIRSRADAGMTNAKGREGNQNSSAYDEKSKKEIEDALLKNNSITKGNITLYKHTPLYTPLTSSSSKVKLAYNMLLEALSLENSAVKNQDTKKLYEARKLVESAKKQLEDALKDLK